MTTQSEAVPDCAVQMIDVITHSVHHKLHSPSLRLPLSVSDTVISPVLTGPTCGAAVVFVTYRMNLRDAQRALIAHMELTLAALCTVTGCTSAALREFAGAPVLRLLHPYLAEQVHQFTWLAGLPPLLLEPYKPTKIIV